MADKNEELVLSIRGMSKSFGVTVFWITLIWI